jgi:hypothetical protein
MSSIITNFYIFILAMVLALLEIQIEGKDGWAKNLPAWKPSAEKWYSKLWARILAGRQLTGYHLAVFGLVFLTLHLPYVFELKLNLENWLKTISFFFMFTVLWDFLWFVLNPHYTVRRFKKNNIPWHHKWLGPLPTDYYGGINLSLAVLIPLFFREAGSVTTSTGG